MPYYSNDYSSSSSDDDYSSPRDYYGWVNVYCDGCCFNNGRVRPRAGVGVYFGDNHELNVSEPCQGRATNNNAEIEAATRAAEQAKEGGFEKIRIHTDSRFVIDCVTKWIGVWKRNGWRTHRKSPVVNRRELQIMMDALKGLEVEWVHVPGHSGDYGNEQADLLARQGARFYRP